MRTDERGAHFIDFQSALECLAEELWSSNQWVDQFEGTAQGLGFRIPRLVCQPRRVNRTPCTLI